MLVCVAEDGRSQFGPGTPRTRGSEREHFIAFSSVEASGRSKRRVWILCGLLKKGEVTSEETLHLHGFEALCSVGQLGGRVGSSGERQLGVETQSTKWRLEEHASEAIKFELASQHAVLEREPVREKRTRLDAVRQIQRVHHRVERDITVIDRIKHDVSSSANQLARVS